MTGPSRPNRSAGPLGRRVARRTLRFVGQLAGRDQPVGKPPFAEYLSLDAPILVGGPRPRHDPGLDADPRLVVLMPHLSLDRMSGGPNTILQITARLVPLGVRIRYVATFGGLEPDEAAIRAHIRQVTGIDADPSMVDFVDASAAGADLAFGAGDVPFATWWRTAHVATAALDVVRAREFVYLIQDFEPGFYPWSTKHALAAATYAMPMRAIVNERLLLDHLRSERIGIFGAADLQQQVVSFTPAVDRTLFVRRKRQPGTPRRAVFYARPRNPRNLFELGLRALRVAIAEGVFDDEPWEFRAIGQKLVDLPLSPRHVLQPVPWLPYPEYAAFLGESDLLLSLMLSPHTSYPPLEMSAAGGTVVTNTFGVKTAEALAAISPAIHAAQPDVAGLVAAMRSAVISSSAAPAFDATVDLPSTWDEALRDVTPWLHQAIEEITQG